VAGTSRRRGPAIAPTAALVLILAATSCGAGESPPKIEAAVSPAPIARATAIPSPAPTPTPSPAPTVTPSPAPTATSEGLPLIISPDVLALPTGVSARYTISVLPGWEGDAPPTWSAEGLPPGVTAQFLTGWGHPAEGPLQIDTPGSLPEGTYTFEVSAAAADKTWRAQAALEVLPCRESVETGSFARSIATDAITHTQGGPSTLTYGIVSPPLQFCAAATARTLRVAIESATSEAGIPLDEPPGFVLYRSLEWPAEDIAPNGGYVPNVTPVAESDGGTLTWEITPGVYLLYFPESGFLTQNAQPFAAYPEVSVTYRVEID
jgi:hypothetical protein